MKKHVINQFDWVLALKNEIDAGVDVHGNPEWRYPSIGVIVDDAHGEKLMLQREFSSSDVDQTKVVIKYSLVDVNYGEALRLTWDARFKRVEGGDFLFVRPDDELLPEEPDDEAPDFSAIQRVALNWEVEKLLTDGDYHWEETIDWATGIPFPRRPDNDMNQFHHKYIHPDGDQATLPSPDDFDDLLSEWVTSDEEHVRELAAEDVEYNHPDIDPDSEEFDELVDEQMEIQLDAKREEAEFYSQQWRKIMSEASLNTQSSASGHLSGTTVAPITEMLNILRRSFDGVYFWDDQVHRRLSGVVLEMLDPENDGGLSSREGDQLLAEMRADKSTYTYLDKMPEVFILQPENFKLWTPDVWSVRRLRAGYHNKQF